MFQTFLSTLGRAFSRSTASVTQDYSPEILSEGESNIRLYQNSFDTNGMAPLHEVNVPTTKATFAMGCFWGCDSLYGATKGVIRTRVGFTGGSMQAPNYRNLGDHTEAIEIDFDQTQVSYHHLLNLFWENHDPTYKTKKQILPLRADWLERQQSKEMGAVLADTYNLTASKYPTHGGQRSKERHRWVMNDARVVRHTAADFTAYTSIVFYHNDEQKAVAEKSAKEIQPKHKSPLVTAIVPASTFYDAEDYHQKYRLQQHPFLMSALGLSCNIAQLTASHVAARLNGYVVGQGGVKQFEEEADKLGLNEQVKDYVKKLVIKFEGSGSFC